MEAKALRPLIRYPPSACRARVSGTGVPTRPDVVGSEKLPAMSLPSCTTILASRALVPTATRGLSMIGPTIEKCMLKASAVEGQPWANSSATSE